MLVPPLCDTPLNSPAPAPALQPGGFQSDDDWYEGDDAMCELIMNVPENVAAGLPALTSNPAQPPSTTGSFRATVADVSDNDDDNVNNNRGKHETTPTDFLPPGYSVGVIEAYIHDDTDCPPSLAATKKRHWVSFTSRAAGVFDESGLLQMELNGFKGAAGSSTMSGAEAFEYWKLGCTSGLLPFNKPISRFSVLPRCVARKDLAAFEQHVTGGKSGHCAVHVGSMNYQMAQDFAMKNGFDTQPTTSVTSDEVDGDQSKGKGKEKGKGKCKGSMNARSNAMKATAHTSKTPLGVSMSGTGTASVAASTVSTNKADAQCPPLASSKATAEVMSLPTIDLREQITRHRHKRVPSVSSSSRFSDISALSQTLSSSGTDAFGHSAMDASPEVSRAPTPASSPIPHFFPPSMSASLASDLRWVVLAGHRPGIYYNAEDADRASGCGEGARVMVYNDMATASQAYAYASITGELREL
ncbi:hypothetical protein BC835DRAFT_1419281 [Cytidiella melzeri]|nr:hypothetical protein BC835DRAFT_1419281 [Cytidiella melzeri]